jgi:hypothetical protein
MNRRWTSNRLSVFGSKRQVLLFRGSNWDEHLHAQYVELMENSPMRLVCEFKTDGPPLEPLRKLSLLWTRLVFVLDYELEKRRIKGLAKAINGELEHHQLRY